MERMYCRSKKENTVIGIRVDGNHEIGMGHLIRCLSVALAFRKNGNSVVFITASEEGREILEKNAFEQIVLHSNYMDMESEFSKLKKIVQDRNIKLMLVDSYQVVPNYLRTIQEWVPVVYFEEEIREQYSVNGIINYNIYALDLPYRTYYEKKVNCYLGSKYAPIRPGFSGRSTFVRDCVKRILILMGGSDAFNISGELIKAFFKTGDETFDKIDFDVVCGPFNVHFEQLSEVGIHTPNVHIHRSVEDMASLMQKSDIVISAAGSTMYELAALGIPTVCCYYVDNQKRIAEGFALHTKVINAGDYSKTPEHVLKTIVQVVTKMVHDKNLRRENADSMKNISDGGGAKRLVDALQRDFL